MNVEQMRSRLRSACTWTLSLAGTFVLVAAHENPSRPKTMSARITFSGFISWVHILATAAILLSVGFHDASAAQLPDYRVQIIADESNRDGPVDRTLHLRITNHVSQSSVALTCHHRTLGQGDWKLRFSSVNVRGLLPEQQGEAMAQVIADATRVAEDILTKNYSTDRVSTVQLDEEGMPSFLTQGIYESLASQMKRNAAKAQPAYDRHLKRMLQTVFDENRVLQVVSKRLEERGFSVTRAEPQELISIRPELAGLTWQKISSESAAGLKGGSATVVFYDLALNGKN